MSLGTLKEMRTREQWREIVKKVTELKYEEAASLCVRYEFWARDIARNMIRDRCEGQILPTAEEFILLTERATFWRTID